LISIAPEPLVKSLAATEPSLQPSLQAASAELLRCRAGASPYAMYAALNELARCYIEQGGLATAEAYLDEALTWSRVLGSQDAEVDVLCQLAEEKQNKGSGSAGLVRARSHAVAASELAPKVADPGWEIKVLLRASDVLEDCGHRVEAIELQIRAVQLLGLEVVRA
jgi:tetratricopeptide (TPR) repeat protein